MAFKLFLTYLMLVFLRPFEVFLPDLADLRPMAILWACTFVASIAGWQKSKVFGAHKSHVWMLMFFWLSIVLSLVFNGLFYALSGAISEFSTSAMLLFLVAMNVTTFDRLKATCTALLVSIILLCIESIYSYHTGWMIDSFVIRQLASDDVDIPPGLTLTMPSEDVTGIYLWRLRNVGFLNDPNDFAQVICMVLPWLLMWYRPGAWLMNPLRIGAPAALMVYAVQLSHSRGGFVGIAMLFFVALIRRIGVFWGAMLGAAGGVAFVIAGQIGGRGFSAKEASANERLDAWYSGMEMFKSSPLFGVGYGQFIEHHIRTAHNSFVLCFAEVGSFGYVCWLAMIIMAFQSLIEVTRSTEKSISNFGWMMMASFSGFLTCAWFLSRTYQASLFMLMGLCFACFCAKVRHGAAQPAQVPLPAVNGWVRPTVVVFALSLIGVSMFVRAAK